MTAGAPRYDVIEGTIAAELDGIYRGERLVAMTRLLAHLVGDQTTDEAEIVAFVHERCFLTESSPWPDLHRRFRPPLHTGSPIELADAIVEELTPRLEVDVPSYAQRALRRARRALEKQAADAASSGRGAARRGDVRQFQHSVCDTAWRGVIGQYVEDLPSSALGALMGRETASEPVRAALRTGAMLVGTALVLGDERSIAWLLANPILPVQEGDQTRLDSDITELERGRGRKGGIAALQTPPPPVPDEHEPAEPETVALPLMPATASRHEDAPGPERDGEHRQEYLDRVGEFLRARIAEARRHLARSDSSRPDIVLESIRADGTPDHERIAAAVRRLRLSRGGKVDARVRRAFVKLHTLLAEDGFVLGEPIRDGERLGSRHLLPPGSADVRDLLPADCLAIVERENAGADTRAHVAAAGLEWPGRNRPYAEWREVREALVTLRRARAELRDRLEEARVRCLAEDGLVVPDRQLPAQLRVYPRFGRRPAVRRPDTDHAAAVDLGRVISLPHSAVALEAKPSRRVRERPEHALPLPDPLHKRHRGMWWYFPEGGVDV